MAYPVPYVWSISGLISYSDGRPFNSGNIKAYDMYGGEEIQIGESGVNSDGSYQITFSSANFQRGDTPSFRSLCPLELTKIGARNGHNEEKIS